VEISIKHSAHINELIEKWSAINNIRYYKNIKRDHRKWNKGGITTYDIQCVILGKTGYGKSTLINKIIGKNVFETSAVNSTTLQMQCADWLLDSINNYYFSIADLPGIGQNSKVDEVYLQWYKEILEKSDCVIYLLRADTREYAIDEKAISDLKIDKNKLILGLNFCDKIEPINRNININLTEKQQQNLNKKVEVISNIFKVSKSNILTISADTMLNVNKLVNKIVEVVTSAN